MPVSKKPRKPRVTSNNVIMRDGWDELNTLLLECQRYSQMARIAQVVIQHMKTQPPESIDKEAFMACTAINKNLPHLVERLNTLKALHIGKTGDANEEDYFTIINISSQYQTWLNDWDSQITSHVTSLTGYAAEKAIENHGV